MPRQKPRLFFESRLQPGPLQYATGTADAEIFVGNVSQLLRCLGGVVDLALGDHVYHPASSVAVNLAGRLPQHFCASGLASARTLLTVIWPMPSWASISRDERPPSISEMLLLRMFL